MSSLRKTVFYLAGPIDAVDDDGKGWRQEFRRGAEMRELEIKFIDPSDKPRAFRAEVGHEKLEVKELKRQYRWKDVKKRVNEFARHDRRGVDIADCLIAYVYHDVHMCGSYFEIYRAALQDKPKFLIIKGGRPKCPPWLFDIFEPEEMFDSVNDCIEKLEEMNSQPLPPHWVLLKDWL